MSDNPQDEVDQPGSDELAVAVRPSPEVIENPWQTLRQFTPARLALGRSGHSLPTNRLLQFQLAHARARDAVFALFDPADLTRQLHDGGYEVLEVTSQATSRDLYLRQPDRGRRLLESSRQSLQDYADRQAGGYDIVFVLGEGLSAQAVHQHGLAVLDLVVSELRKENWSIGPVVVAGQARVALGDEIGEILKAEQVAILIGERPGLSAAESLGIYLTYRPQVGRLESERNCISNIHPSGASYEAGAGTLLYLMRQVRQLKLSGVRLKDDRNLS